jgi:hypothetical protein
MDDFRSVHHCVLRSLRFLFCYTTDPIRRGPIAYIDLVGCPPSLAAAAAGYMANLAAVAMFGLSSFGPCAVRAARRERHSPLGWARA